MEKQIEGVQNEIKEVMIMIGKNSKDIGLRMTIEEGSKIWSNFSKYAVYDDLKELYKRCLPAISSFEDKLVVFTMEHKRN